MRRILGLVAAMGLATVAWAQDEESPRYEDVFFNAREVWMAHETRHRADDDRIDSDVLYVLGNIANTMFHEFGHALVSEFELPVEGSEEDEVDALANVVMVSETNSEYLDRMIEAVADDWFIQGEYDESQGPSEDGHSVPADRAYAVVCILVGSDPEYFGEVAENAGLEPAEQQECQGTYEDAHTRWDQALAEHYLGENEEPSIEIPIEYGEPAEGQEMIAEFVQASGLIEDIVEQMRWTIRFPNPITVGVESCGEENAFWSPDERKVTLCYEIVLGYYNRATDQGPDAGLGQGDAEDEESDLEG